MSFFLPTKIKFGEDKFKQIGKLVKEYGSSVLLVSTALEENRIQSYEFVKAELVKNNISVAIFNKVEQNPTTDIVMEGKKVAVKNSCNVIVAMGGGSTIDTAKAIAIAATHDLDIEYYFYNSENQPTYKTLPIIAITTTSGTGSHVTPYCVLTKSDEKLKSTIVSPNIFPKLSIINPKLMLTKSSSLTSFTGFDAFSHGFESYVHKNASEITDLYAYNSLKLIVENLEKAFVDGDDLLARTNLAWADTFSGAAIANTGVSLPHALAMPISGQFPSISHGAALAIIYPAFLKYSWNHSIGKFAKVARLFDNALNGKMDEYAAEQLPRLLVEWQETIECKLSLSDFGIKEEDIDELVKQALKYPDLKMGPKIATEEDIIHLYKESL